MNDRGGGQSPAVIRTASVEGAEPRTLVTLKDAGVVDDIAVTSAALFYARKDEQGIAIHRLAR